MAFETGWGNRTNHRDELLMPRSRVNKLTIPEKVMGRFKSPRQAQRFLAAHDQANTIFRPRRYRISAISYRHARADAFDLWNAFAVEMTA